MRMQMVGLLRILAVLFTMVPAGYSASAQTNDSGDLTEVEHYTLTMDNVTRLMQTFGDLNKYGKEHPEAKAATSNDSGVKESLSNVEKRISKYPPLVSILQSHKFTVREFLVAEVALLQSSMAQALDPTAKAPEGVNPENLKFVREHKAELEALQKQYGVNND